MIELGGKKILLGGFHDHWARADMENPSLFLASLSYYHYDFMTLQDGHELNRPIIEAAAALSREIKLYSGKEEFYGWGHVVTVGGKKTAPPSDEADFRKVLRELKDSCELIFLAHPTYPETWKQLFKTGEMDRLMDEGLVDGINLINTSGFADPGHRELIEWYKRRDLAGKHTPIAGGWDAHLLLPDRNLPKILYDQNRSPKKHIDTAGDNRTILFAEENSLEAIREAVRAGRTVIEDLETGDLVGPAPLVAFLQENGYRKEILRRNDERDATRLSVSGEWIAGEKANASVSEQGELSFPKSFTESKKQHAPANATLNLGEAPPLLERDFFYLPVVFQNEKQERIWAVETRHPIQFDIHPKISGDNAGVEIIPRLPFTGTIDFELEGLLNVTEMKISGPVTLPIEKSVDLFPHRFRFRAVLEKGAAPKLSRKKEGFLNFAGIKKWNGNWNDSPEIRIDDQRFAPHYSYGANRPYPGPDVFSTKIRFAWTEKEFLFRADVRDDIHYNPYEDRWLYNGDCLQLALDPLYLREETIGSIYAWNLALPKNGPAVFRFLTPTELPGPELKNDVPVGKDFLHVDKIEGGLRYELRLPWTEMPPFQPKPGAKLGVYFIIFNNNGTGHLDTLHWPVPIDGMWMTPSKWGSLILE